MRRGTQGHVAVPRGPRECLHGTEVTCHVFIFNRNSMVIVHISIRYFGFKLTVINRSPYIPDASPKFPPCGTIILRFV